MTLKNKSKYIFTPKNKFIFFIAIISLHYFVINFSQNEQKNFYQRRIEYLKTTNRHYNESNLITFEDKINWLAIHDVKKLKGKCADKIKLHEYSKRILKKDICNKILKVYNNVTQIDISKLPEQFVLKTNHGSGFNIIVYNKTKLDVELAKKKLSNWLSIDYGKNGAEFHYSFINRKVFAEEYIGKYLNNYKFLCYQGIPKFIFIYKKVEGKEYRTFFDMQWNRLDFYCVTPPHPTDFYPKPKTFELMKKYASKLSKPFRLARVDLYDYENEVRLGEITFLPMNSNFICKKKEHNIELGKYIKLF